MSGGAQTRARSPRRSAHHADCTRQPGSPLDGGRDDRAWIVFDVNGTLASDSKRRRSLHGGGIAARPNLSALSRLRPTFRIALYSSMQTQNMSKAVKLVEGIRGINAPLDAVLHRTSPGGCRPAPHPRVKHWSTVKPLDAFRDTVRGGLSRVVLVDDSADKVVNGQEASLLLVPAWEEQEIDQTLELLVDALLAAETAVDSATGRADAGSDAGSDVGTDADTGAGGGASIDDVAAALGRMKIERRRSGGNDLSAHLSAISSDLFVAFRAQHGEGARVPSGGARCQDRAGCDGGGDSEGASQCGGRGGSEQ